MVDNIEIITFSELIDKLMIINIKLYNLLSRTAILDAKTNKTDEDIKEIVQLSGENIRLIKQRSSLKSAIDKKLNQSIKSGDTDIFDEIKKYE